MCRFPPTLLFLVCLPATLVRAQGLDQRIEHIRDGRVRFSFPTRPGVCGDGSFVGLDTPRGFRTYRFSGDGYSTDLLEDVMPACTTGPMRFVVVKAAGQVTGLRAAVGVSWRPAEGTTDLGVVSAAEVVAWLLDVVPTLGGGRAAVAFLAASSADDARVADRLLRIAGNRALATPVRAAALRWGFEAALREGTAPAATDALRAMAGDESEPSTLRDRAVRELDLSPANLGFLHTLYARTRETPLRERILRRAGEARTDAEAAWLTEVVTDASQPRQLRERALRVLAQEMGRPQDVRVLYPRLDAELKDRALRLAVELAQEDAMPWVRGIALSEHEPVAVRDRALRLLAEHGATSADLATLYDRVSQASLKERVIRLLAERGDDVAVEKLAAIAGGDPDASRRRTALRRLGESKNPKAGAFLDAQVSR